MSFFNSKMDTQEDSTKVFATLVARIIFGFIGTYILQLIWNHFAPMFNLPVLGYWEMYALKIGAHLLFGEFTT